MGYGDDIIASGMARVAQETDPRKVRPMLEKGHRWSDVWKLNPRIAQPGEECDFQEVVVREKHLRPYMTEKTWSQWFWKEYRPPRGELYFSKEERDFGQRHAGRVVLEPHNKRGASPNKAWPWVSWNKLAWLLHKDGVRVSQLGPGGTAVLDGVEYIETRNFRLAASVLSTARACVLPEGGLHHAAAALGTPAVVIFGGFISPRVTGYDDQVSLFVGDDLGCGSRQPCNHCKAAMASIKPEMVAEKLMSLLSADQRDAA